jgi:cytochrome P450
MPISAAAGGLAYLNAETPTALTGPVDLNTTGGEAPIVIRHHQGARALLKDQRWCRQPAATHGPIGPASAMSVTNMDAPRHSAIRNLIGPMFSRRAVSGLQEQARQTAHRLCDQLLHAGPPADLASQFCGPFTFLVHCDLLGIPEHARSAIQQASLRRSGQPDATARETYDAETVLHSEVTAVLAYLQRHGGSGIYPQLITLDHAGLLDARELRGLASSLLFDGHILTSSQIANTIAALLCYPAARSAVGSQGLPPAAREELLRWSPAITLGMPRRASAAVRLGDAIVPEGQTAIVAFGIVNRDPAVFDHPGILDLGRHPNRHLAFGYGIHYCLGAHLARLQLDVAVSVLLTRLPGLRLAVDERELTWSASHTIRRLCALPVTWHREAPPTSASLRLTQPPLRPRLPAHSHARGSC